MICRVFVSRHVETTHNSRRIFSGWRDKIDYVFTSHLKRARKTLEIVLETRPAVPVFTDDQPIERCYGCFKLKTRERLPRKDLNGLPRFTEAAILHHRKEKA